MGDMLSRHSLHSWSQSYKPCRPWLLRERCGPEDRKQLERSPAVKAVGGQRIGWEKKGISSYGAWIFIKSVQYFICLSSIWICDMRFRIDYLTVIGLCMDLWCKNRTPRTNNLVYFVCVCVLTRSGWYSTQSMILLIIFTVIKVGTMLSSPDPFYM